MSVQAMSDVVRQLERAFAGESVNGLDERALLQRYVTRGEAAAFEMLLARHGPMVLSVCRRLLSGDPHAVDDAFQATFLVLVRRARSIRDPGRLGPWLYGVAHRVARRARANAARLRKRERGAELMTASSPTAQPPHDDPCPELHEELARLPRAYRDVLVLCDLESRTHEETANLLGWPLGTVKGRLSRAREQLRQRLQRRGVTLGAAALAAVLARDAAAVVPSLLVERTLRAANGLAGSAKAAGAGIVSAQALALSDGVTQSMMLTKLGTIAAVLVTAGTITTASALVAGSSRARQDDTPTKGGQEAASRPSTAINESTHREITAARAALAKARIGLLVADYDRAASIVLTSLPDQSRTQYDNVREASLRVLRAEKELEVASAVEGHLKRMMDFEAKVNEVLAHRNRGGSDGGSSLVSSVPETGVLVAEARLWVALARAGEELMGLGERSPLHENDQAVIPDGEYDARTRAILKVLNRPIPMPFGTETPLSDVMKYIESATVLPPDLPTGIPIFIDHGGLQTAEKTMDSPVQFKMEGVPLKTTLRLLLRQLDLNYLVKDGLVVITDVDNDAFYADGDMLGDPPIAGYGGVPASGLKERKPEPEGTGGVQKGQGGFQEQKGFQ